MGRLLRRGGEERTIKICIGAASSRPSFTQSSVTRFTFVETRCRRAASRSHATRRDQDISRSRRRVEAGDRIIFIFWTMVGTLGAVS